MATPKRHRSFAPKQTVELEPLTFDLLDGKHEFECKPVLQGAIILDFVASSEGEATSGAAHLLEFIHKALLTDDDRLKFDAVIRSEDPDDNIEIEELTNIVTWLVEEYTSRPTQASTR